MSLEKLRVVAPSPWTEEQKEIFRRYGVGKKTVALSEAPYAIGKIKRFDMARAEAIDLAQARCLAALAKYADDCLAARPQGQS
jgi:hypothetical protein